MLTGGDHAPSTPPRLSTFVLNGGTKRNVAGTQDPDTDPGSRAYTTHLTLSVRPSDSVPKLTWGVLTEQAMWRFLRGGSGTDFAKVVWEQVRSVVVVRFF